MNPARLKFFPRVLPGFVELTRRILCWVSMEFLWNLAGNFHERFPWNPAFFVERKTEKEHP